MRRALFASCAIMASERLLIAVLSKKGLIFADFCKKKGRLAAPRTLSLKLFCVNRAVGFVHRSQASGADIGFFEFAGRSDEADLLDVCAPSPSVFTIGVADFVAALASLAANTAYFRHRR